MRAKSESALECHGLLDLTVIMFTTMLMIVISIDASQKRGV